MNTQPPLAGRLLGIDHGRVRIGVAVSDATGLIARELTIIRRTTKEEDFEKLRRLAAEQQAVAVVVGIPMDVEREAQRLYSSADTVKAWIVLLQAAISLPIVVWDETLTTVEAHELASTLRRKRGLPVDDLAARILLQSYLDAVRDGLATPPNLAE
jgi:putative Holliday junction resolvase